MGLEALVFGQSAQGSRANICYLTDLTNYWVPFRDRNGTSDDCSSN